MEDKYFEYLRKRTVLGLIYRKFWLYPYIKHQLHGSVLDVGCGIGDFLRCCSSAVGVDVNPRTVEWCRVRGLNVHLMEQNKLPFDDGIFDNAVLDNVLEHVPEPSRLLSEVRRILRPNGILMVGVPGPSGYFADTDHKVFYDQVSLISTLETAGFIVETLDWKPFRSGWLAERLPQFTLYGRFRR